MNWEPRYPSFFYAVISLFNVMLRMTWALNMLPGSTISRDPVINHTIVLFVALFELYRRSQWLILRVEHEHLTNRSKFRTLCYVPDLRPLAPQTGQRLWEKVSTKEANE